MLHKWQLTAFSWLARWLSEAPGVAEQYLLLNLLKLVDTQQVLQLRTASDVVHVPDVCKLHSGKKLLPVMYASSGRSLIALSSTFVKIVHLRLITEPQQRISPPVIALSCLGAYMTQLLVTRFVQSNFQQLWLHLQHLQCLWCLASRVCKCAWCVQGKELQGEVEGILAMKQSWPSIMRTLYGDHKRYEETYFSAYKVSFSILLVNTVIIMIIDMHVGWTVVWLMAESRTVPVHVLLSTWCADSVTLVGIVTEARRATASLGERCSHLGPVRTLTGVNRSSSKVLGTMHRTATFQPCHSPDRVMLRQEVSQELRLPDVDKTQNTFHMKPHMSLP